MSNKDGSSTISIHFEERPDKPTIHVSGAYGGVEPVGASVVAHVYTEWNMIPSIQQVEVGSDGSVDFSKAQTIKRGDIQREVQASLVMTPETAISFGKWLVEKGIAATKQRALQPPQFTEEKEPGE